MAPNYFRFVFFILFVFIPIPGLSLSSPRSEHYPGFVSHGNLLGDAPSLAPAPAPASPPHDRSFSCVDDLGGVGSLDTTCKLIVDLNLTRDMYVSGKGNFHILPRVRFMCPVAGCSIVVNMTGNFSMGENSTILAGSFHLAAGNASLAFGSAIDTVGMAGDPPPDSSGKPEGIKGSGGGYGGRGACCLTEKGKLPEDVWGGEVYSWMFLERPFDYGSRGGSTSNEIDYGGGGGGRVGMEIVQLLELNGSLLADGADGGVKGGGGSGGSIYVNAHKMTGTGRISASGGDGFAGGGGGRVAVDVFSRHSDPKIYVHGGNSFGCPENSGAAGTLYDAVSRSLAVDNNNMTTDTDTLLLEFPYHPLMNNVYIRNHAKATAPLRWSRVQVQGQISLSCSGRIGFGLRYESSEFELFAEELLMSDSMIKVYGALRMTVKMFLMWNSRMLINEGGVAIFGTSLLEASNFLVLKESSVIHSNGNLGVHGQGLLNLSGPGDTIEAQRLILSLFYGIHVGSGAVLRGPLQNVSSGGLTPRLHCDSEECPVELLHPPEDCNVNSSLSFTLQVCRVEDITVGGLIKGSVIHFHLARTVTVHPSGAISANGMGCKGGVGRGKFLGNGIGSGGGHGGKGGKGCHDHSCVEGGAYYGNADLPCELGSGSGEEDSSDSATGGGGIIVIGSMEHPLSSLSLEGSVTADGGSSRKLIRISNNSRLEPGGGSGGTVLVFLRSLTLGESAVLSSAGGNGSLTGAGGGGGGRIHFDWADIPTGDMYHPIASAKGRIHVRGGSSINDGGAGENGTITSKDCPKGLFGLFCEECPAGTYKNATGSDKALCHLCPANELPHRAMYIAIRGGVAETPCPYRCVSDRYHMPHCYTTLEELIYTFGGPWWFGLSLVGVLLLLALVFSVARMKFVGVDELTGSAPTQHGSQIDHSFPFLESLTEVMETSRVEESQTHVHRIYMLGANTFSKPWHLSHTPPQEIREIVYEAAFNAFIDEINAFAAYQWWEGAVYGILSVLVYPLAWSWRQWRRRLKFKRLQDYVRSEYDHSCLRSCRSRALYEGLKVAATPDLTLAYLDFFLGGDEKKTALPPDLNHRFPMPVIFGGDGSYMAPFSLQSDDILTSLMSQLVPPTTWYRLVAGLNAQLLLVRYEQLRVSLRPVLRWLETLGNPALRGHGVRVDLARFQTTVSGYCQYGLLIHAIEDGLTSRVNDDRALQTEQHPRSIQVENSSGDLGESLILNQDHRSNIDSMRHQYYGGIIGISSLQMLEDKKNASFLLSFLLYNTKPFGHQDLVGLVISILFLGDLSLVLLTLLQLYSISLLDVFLALFILPLGLLFPFPAGINALFSHGPRRSATRARLYALWNLTSLVNVAVALICGYLHYNAQTSSSKKIPYLQPWNISMDEKEWWVFSVALVLVKILQSQLINRHVANLEIQDLSLYSNDFDLFWQA